MAIGNPAYMQRKKKSRKNMLFVVVLFSVLLITVGVLMPRQINYDPKPGLKPQLLVDLDPASNKITVTAESITSDKEGNLYIGTNRGEILRINSATGQTVKVGQVPDQDGKAINLLGIKFDKDGNIYVATGGLGQVWKLDEDKISSSSPGGATVFVTGLGFTNDIAFDRFGRMFVSNSITGVLWEIDMKTREKQEFANQLLSRNQQLPFGINGMAMAEDGTLYFSNTGNGVIHQVETRKEDGRIVSVTVWRSHEALIGADGIAFDKAGNLWVAVNGRNALLAITPENRRIIEITKNDNTGPLEFPSSVAFSGESIFILNFDIGAGENGINEPGIGPSIVRIQLGVEGKELP